MKEVGCFKFFFFICTCLESKETYKKIQHIIEGEMPQLANTF